MPTTIQPVIIENNVQFTGLVLSHREMLRITGVSHGAILKSYPVFVRAAVLPMGYVDICWRQSHQKETMSFYACRDRRVFSQLSRIWVELIRRTGCPVVFRMVQGCLVVDGYQSRHPDQCPRLTHHYHCRRSMLADMPQNWNHQHWSHPIFDDESRVSLCRSDHRACEFHLFPGSNNPLAFQQHDEKLGHARYSCTGWLWNHQHIGSNCGTRVPTCGSSGNGQESVWVVGLAVLLSKGISWCDTHRIS